MTTAYIVQWYLPKKDYEVNYFGWCDQYETDGRTFFFNTHHSPYNARIIQVLDEKDGNNAHS